MQELIADKEFLDEEDYNNKLAKLYLDPTIWAYATLTDKQNNPLKLRYYQDAFINEKNRFVVCIGANQIGKTWSICIKALHHALHVENASVIIVSRSEPQSTAILDEIKWFMRRSEVALKSLIDEVENRTEIHFRVGNGVSRIKCVPSTEGALGYPATLIIGDEIAFWENGSYIYNQVVEPRTNETVDWPSKVFTMGQVMMITNPNGKQGVGWELWIDQRYACYRFCWLANPKKKFEDYDAIRDREGMISAYFDSIYAAEFTSATGGFITQAEYEKCIINEEINGGSQEFFFLGGDFAGQDTTTRDTDFTVLYGVEVIKTDDETPAKVRIVFQKEYPRKVDHNVVYADMLLLRGRIAKFAYDRIGVSDSIKNDLIDKGILNEYQIDVLTYSLPNKTDIYTNMKHLFEQGRLEIPKDIYPQLKEQLLGLQFELTLAGHLNKPGLKIHHSSGLHDDHADAFANACYAALRLSQAQPNIWRSDMEDKPRIDEEGKFADKSKFAECLKCEANWKYNKEQECPECGEGDSMVWYVTGEKIK